MALSFGKYRQYGINEHLWAESPRLPHGVMAAHGSLEPFVLVRVQVGGQKGLCLGGYSDPLDMTGPSPPIRTGTLSDTARPNPSPTTEILPCGRPFLRDLLDSTVQGGNRLC